MEQLCRICYDETNMKNPLLTPCNCKGSIAFIHKKCLLKWIKTSLAQQCELCKTQYAFEEFLLEKLYKPSWFILYICRYPHIFYLYIISVYIGYLLYDTSYKGIPGNKKNEFNMLIIIGFNILPYMLTLLATIQMILLTPAIYALKQKYRYLQYALSCSKIANMRISPLTYFIMILFSIYASFYFTVAGPLFLLYLTSQLYGVHTVIILKINSDSMRLEDE